MRILRSLRYAIKGINYCIENERNMRIHTVIGAYILILSAFFGLSYEKIMILILTISAVLVAEMVNTAIERLIDMLEASYNVIAKMAKDIAAGAVLVSSLFAVVEGVIIFSDVAGFLRLWRFFCEYPILIIFLIISLVLSYWYIFWGPKGIKNVFMRIKLKIKNGKE